MNKREQDFYIIILKYESNDGLEIIKNNKYDKDLISLKNLQ